MKSLEVDCVSLTSSILTFSFQSCISSDNSDNTNSFGFLSLKISFWFNFHCSHRVTTLGWINRFFYRTEWQTEKNQQSSYCFQMSQPLCIWTWWTSLDPLYFAKKNFPIPYIKQHQPIQIYFSTGTNYLNSGRVKGTWLSLHHTIAF